MAADASTPVLTRSLPRWVNPVNVIGLCLVGLLAVWLVVNFVKSPSQFFEASLIGITNGCVYALVALGYTLVYGILELINFAHGDVFMLGGMFAISFATWFGLAPGPWYEWMPLAVLILILCAICCAVINATIEFVAYRPLRHAPRLAPLITAIGVSFILETIAQIWKGSDYVSFPEVLPTTNMFTIGGVGVPWTTPIVVLLTVPVLIGLTFLVRSTKQGKAMRATAQDRDAAAIMGINVNRTISFTFLLAGSLAGAGGLVFGMSGANLNFQSGFTLGLIAFTSAVLGGIGNLTGAVLGALLIGLIQAYNEALTWHAPGSDWTESLVFTILILILVFRPEGLLGERTPEGG
ncbi:MAG TPA: branched-chain amino acid ABC transporter permease [Candidatus Methylomirabilis sp.]|nr:branched-chain amino acid ABC transporter permease [Candidatus Methylomirabilis sp.]